MVKKSNRPVLPAENSSADPLAGFTPATRAWFASAFAAPTAVQQAAWAAIGTGDSSLVIAPTGSGKTLAAFLHAIDRLFDEGSRGTPGGGGKEPPKAATRVLYISPLKALGADVRKNLRIPLHGVARARESRGDPSVEVTVGMRTGDTPASERAGLVRRPPDILITTPESLYLMLTSKARETLRGVRTVIVDEVHAVAGTKRGAHLAVSLERLDALLPSPAQRVGLSATVRPVDRVAEFLGGALPVTVVSPKTDRRLDLRIVVPVEDMTDMHVPPTASPGASSGAPERAGRAGSIWFHVESSILDRVLRCRSTIVFVNSRGLAERLTARLNELYAERNGIADSGDGGEARQYDSNNGGTDSRSTGLPPLIARSHHGSVSKERRAEIEQDLKSGELRCVVATSSLELGIDMGQVDLVIQVAAPPSVSAGMQRVGRASHHVGGTPLGLVYPRTRRDLVDAAVVVESMLAGRIEAISPPRNPLDILAQQTVAAVAMDPLRVEEWYVLLRRSDPFRALPRSVFDATLDMLAGRFPSDEFAEFRPRLVWDRNSGTLTARPGAQRLAVINGGTIPDRGTYSVVLPEGEEQAGSRRVGELDEEMVYESRVNDVITLGASSWRIRQITNDHVVVIPAPGKSARLPFWHGDGPGRPAELGEAVGAFLRDMDPGQSPDQMPGQMPGQSSDQPAGQSQGGHLPHGRLLAAGLDANASTNLCALLAEQRAATGALPTDRTLVMERCRDEVGDWRVMLHSPYGRRVHAPWALAVAERIRQRYKVDAAVVASDDGIVVKIPDTAGRLPGAELFAFDADGMRRLVTEAVGTSALFAARFRECAARALLLPRRAPGRRSPLWQQRLRAGQLLEVAREHPDFPILIETARECLQDVYDLPALDALMRRIAGGEVRLVDVTTDIPSPFAANLLFGYVGEFMYAYDAPLAERRASLLSLDIGLLGDLLGQTDFSELLDPRILDRMAGEMQHTAEDRRVSGLEGVADLLRELGPLSTGEVAARLDPGDADGRGDMRREAAGHLAALAAAHRAIAVSVGGEERWAAMEDASRLRDALGVRLPGGIPAVFLEAVADPLRDMVSRYARTHTPFTTGQLAARLGLGVAVADTCLDRLREQGRVLRGEFGAATAPGGMDAGSQGYQGHPAARHEWVWEDVFRRLRARSLQAAREATRPVDRAAYVRQLLERQYLLPEPQAAASVVPHGAALGHGGLYGVDGVARVVEQLSGVALPASLWESHVLPARVRDYLPGMLDELMAAGEVLWSGSGPLGDHDGLVALHLREIAAETLPGMPPDTPPDTLASGEETGTELRQAILAVMADGGAYFARRMYELVRSPAGGGHGAGPSAGFMTGQITPEDLREALWRLAWSGRVTTDTWTALRAYIRGKAPGPARRTRSVRRRLAGGGYQTYTFTPKAGGTGLVFPDDPALAGRWSLLPRVSVPETARALAMTEGLLATAEGLLDRYGIVTRGAVMAEGVPGGFPTVQRVFRGMEDAGRVLRGRFVDGLGAAQFADHAAVNRLREYADGPGDTEGGGAVVALSAADPANPFGVALPWPSHPSNAKPTRRAGAYVVIGNGRLLLWLAPGGRSLMTFIENNAPDAAGRTHAAAKALAAMLSRAGSGSVTIESVDGRAVDATPMGAALHAAGFSRTPKGLCWYGRPRSAS